MNYIKELNAFYNQIVFQPLSGSAVALWNTLMHFNNLCGWKREFSVAATQLQLKAGLKATSFQRAWDELKEISFITVTSRGSNQEAVYQMISQQMDFEQNIPEEQSRPSYPSNKPTPVLPPNENNHQHIESYYSLVSNDDHHANVTDNDSNNDRAVHHRDSTTDDSMDHRTIHTTGSFFIQKNIKQEENLTTAVDAIRFSQDNFGTASPFIMEDITSWINDMAESLVLHAMKLGIEQGKLTWRYVKGILKAWARKGITTLDEVEMEQATFHNRNTQRSRQTFVQPHDEIVPDWFKDLKQKQEEPVQQTKPNLDPAAIVREQQEIEELLAKYSGKVKKENNDRIVVP